VKRAMRQGVEGTREKKGRVVFYRRLYYILRDALSFSNHNQQILFPFLSSHSRVVDLCGL